LIIPELNLAVTKAEERLDVLRLAGQKVLISVLGFVPVALLDLDAGKHGESDLIGRVHLDSAVEILRGCGEVHELEVGGAEIVVDVIERWISVLGFC
jgi:hypothetical protein